jgi:hypothetical protein
LGALFVLTGFRHDAFDEEADDAFALSGFAYFGARGEIA